MTLSKVRFDFCFATPEEDAFKLLEGRPPEAAFPAGTALKKGITDSSTTSVSARRMAGLVDLAFWNDTVAGCFLPNMYCATPRYLYVAASSSLVLADFKAVVN